MASIKDDFPEWMPTERLSNAQPLPSAEDLGPGVPEPGIVYTMLHAFTRVAKLSRAADGTFQLRIDGFDVINTYSADLDLRLFDVAEHLRQSSIGGEVDPIASKALMEGFRAFDINGDGEHEAWAFGQQVAGLLQHISYKSHDYVVHENGVWEVIFEGVDMTASGEQIAETVNEYIHTHNDQLKDPFSLWRYDGTRQVFQFLQSKLQQLLKGKQVEVAKRASQMPSLKKSPRKTADAMQSQEQNATPDAQASPESDQTVQPVSARTTEQIHPPYTLAAVEEATQSNTNATPAIVKSPQSPTVHPVESTQSTSISTDQCGEKAVLYKAPVSVHRDALVHDHVHEQQPGLIPEAQAVSRKRKATDELPEGEIQAYRSPKSRKTSNEDFAGAPVDSVPQPPTAVAAVQHSGVEAASGSLHSGSASSRASSSPVSVSSNGTLAHPGNLSQSSTATSVSTLWPPRIPNPSIHRDLFRGPRIVKAQRHIKSFPIPTNKDLREKVLAGNLHTENVAGLNLWLQIHCFQTEGISSHQIFNTVASYILNTPQFEDDFYGAPVPTAGPLPPLPQAQVAQMGQPGYVGPQQQPQVIPQAHTQPVATQSNGIANVPTTQAKAKAPTPTLRELAELFVRTRTLSSYTVPQLKDFFRKVCNDTLNTRTAKKDHWMNAIKSDAKVMREVAKIEAENQLAQDQLVQQYQQQSQQLSYQQPQSSYQPYQPQAHQPPHGQKLNYQQPQGYYQPQVHQPPQGYQGPVDYEQAQVHQPPQGYQGPVDYEQAQIHQPPQGYQGPVDYEQVQGNHQQGQNEYLTLPNDQPFIPGQYGPVNASEPSEMAVQPVYQTGRPVSPASFRNAHNGHLGGPMSQRAGVRKQLPQTRPALSHQKKAAMQQLQGRYQHGQTPDADHHYSGIPNAVNHALPSPFQKGIYIGPMGEQQAQTYEDPQASRYFQQGASIQQVSSNDVIDLTDELADGLHHQMHRQASPPKSDLANGSDLPSEPAEVVGPIDENMLALWHKKKHASQLKKPVNVFAQRRHGVLIDKDPNVMSSAVGINKAHRYNGRGSKKAPARPIPTQGINSGTQEAPLAEQDAIGSSNDQFSCPMPPMSNEDYGMQSGYPNQFNDLGGFPPSSENAIPGPPFNGPGMLSQDGTWVPVPQQNNDHSAYQMPPMFGQDFGSGTAPTNQLNDFDDFSWDDTSFPDPSYNHQEMHPQNDNWADPNQGIDPALLNLGASNNAPY